MHADEHLSLYDRPDVYDVAFSPGTTVEVERVCTLFGRYARAPVTSVLEAACGSGRLLLALAGRGYRAHGYDAHPAMVAFTAGRIVQSGLGERVEVSRMDLRSARDVAAHGAALCMINSLGYLHHDVDVVAHFRGTAASLRPGGLYVVQLACAWRDPSLAGIGAWEASRDGMHVHMAWQVVDEDPVRERSHQRCRVHVRSRRETLAWEEAHELRLWRAGRLRDLAAQAGFGLEAVHTEDLTAVEDVDPPGELGNLYFVFRT